MADYKIQSRYLSSGEVQETLKLKTLSKRIFPQCAEAVKKKTGKQKTLIVQAMRFMETLMLKVLFQQGEGHGQLL